MRELCIELLNDFKEFVTENLGFMLILTFGLALIFLGPVAAIVSVILCTIMYVTLGVIFDDDDEEES